MRTRAGAAFLPLAVVLYSGWSFANIGNTVRNALSSVFYASTYTNLVLTGESKEGPVALVAGSHSRNFPYAGTAPWDEGLLLVGPERFHFTQRTHRAALRISDGEISYAGSMIREKDGKEVPVEVAFSVETTNFTPLPLGIPGLGMLWQPCELDLAKGTVKVDSRTVEVTEGHGQLEHGTLSMPRLSFLAIAYDYVSVAAGGKDGYAFVEFTAKPLALAGTPLDPKNLTDRLDPTPFGFTLAKKKLVPGNIEGVARPVTLFENVVDLGLAKLHRQMVRTKDASGHTLYGLREVFEKVDQGLPLAGLPAAPRGAGSGAGAGVGTGAGAGAGSGSGSGSGSGTGTGILGSSAFKHR